MTIKQQVCARCNAILECGKTPFFEVKIEAISDPGTPDLEDLAEDCDDPEAEYLRLVGQLSATSTQEAMDQIALSRVLFMCVDCLPDWIEDPVKTQRIGRE